MTSLFIYCSTVIPYFCFSSLFKASNGDVLSSYPCHQRQKLHARTKRAARHRVMQDWRWGSVLHGSLADTRQGSNRCGRLLLGCGLLRGSHVETESWDVTEETDAVLRYFYTHWPVVCTRNHPYTQYPSWIKGASLAFGKKFQSFTSYSLHFRPLECTPLKNT